MAFANCTDLPFRGKNRFHVNLRTMPDRVHPNRRGWRQLYDKCLKHELKHLERRATLISSNSLTIQATTRLEVST